MSEHKVTCGVRLDVLEGVVAEVRTDLGEAGVRHRLVVSGSGDWRFVDLVPAEAGKLQVSVGGAGGRRLLSLAAAVSPGKGKQVKGARLLRQERLLLRLLLQPLPRKPGGVPLT